MVTVVMMMLLMMLMMVMIIYLSGLRRTRNHALSEVEDDQEQVIFIVNIVNITININITQRGTKMASTDAPRASTEDGKWSCRKPRSCSG